MFLIALNYSDLKKKKKVIHYFFLFFFYQLTALIYLFINFNLTNLY